VCYCDASRRLATCFRYDEDLDRCSSCLHGGRCVSVDRGDVRSSVCICASCYSGSQCQFNSNSFTLTLDQLFHADLVSHHKKGVVIALIVGSLLYFLIALPNNVFAFVTVSKPACRRSSIAQYLLYMSLMNQLNLGVLVARLTHISVKISALIPPSSIDKLLCISFHYLLTSSSRLVYWLSTWIAIERLYMTAVIRGDRLNNPRTARQLIVIIAVLVLSSGSYEARFIEFLRGQSSGSASMCIARVPAGSRNLWTRIHVSVSMLHTFVPFLINLGCTIAISILVVQRKIKTMSFDQSKISSLIRLPISHSLNRSSSELISKSYPYRCADAAA
jgi:hypothetical protein